MAPSRLSILFADDDPVFTQIVEAALKKAGWLVTVARDAMQAVMFAVRTPPDLIMLDITMPGGNGLAALQKLKASDKTRLVTVLVVSGTTDPALPAKALALGAVEFWPKPLDPVELPARLKAVLETQRITRERALEAVSRIGLAGCESPAVLDYMSREHKTAYAASAIETALEQLRVQRKLVKKQTRWFIA